jgi:lysophospholipase L1-like esterase
MADINKLKDKIKSTIYPNGKGAINASDHQAMLLDMADGMAETDTKLATLSAEIGSLSLEFNVTTNGVNPSVTCIEYSSSDVAYVGVKDASNCIEYLFFYGYKADGTSEIIVADFPSNHLFKFDGGKYTKVGVYVGSAMVASSGVATLMLLVGNSATIKQIKTEATTDEQITIVPTIARDGYYIDENLAVAAFGAYCISAPIFLKKGDKVFYKAFAKTTFAQLSECDENGTLLELLQNGSGERPFYHNFVAPKDMHICICSTKDNIGDVVIQRNIKEAINLVEEKLTKRVSALEGESVLKDRNIINLCDMSKATEGIYVKYDGTEGTSSSHYASDYIPVVYGETYSMPVDAEFFGEALAARIVCFNSKKEYIGGITGTIKGAICTITITNSAAYIRTSIRNVSNYRYKWGQNFDTYMVVNSDTYPNRYIPYGDTSYYADYELAPQNADLFNPLFGKSVVFDGDSICNALSEGTSLGWAGRIGRKNMMLWQNYAIGGGTITSISGKHVISTQSYDNANPDYIIIEGGTNDADVIGSILNGQTPAAYGSYEPNKYDGDYDNTTFCGAVEFLFKRLLTTYPSAKIGVIIAPKMSVASSYTKEGNNRRAYFETLMQLCKKWGIPYLNLWDKGRLNPSLSVFYNDSEESFYTDGQHLTAKGYDVITPMIEAWMKTL